MKAVAVILALLAFIVCLFVGIQAGSSLARPPSPLTAEQPPNGAQRTIALVLVDDLQADKPALIATSFAAYLPQHAAFTFIPLYPELNGREDGRSQTLAQAFAIARDGAPVPAFFEALKAYRVSWNGYLMIDRAGSRVITAMLESPDVDVSDPGWLSTQDTPPAGDPTAGDDWLTREGVFCDKINARERDIDWAKLFAALVPDHVHTNLGIQMLVADWKTMLQADEPFTCKVTAP